MSVQRSIELEVYAQGKTYFDCLRILFEYDWTPFDSIGEIVYLAVGDVAKFDFKTAASLDFVLQTVQERLDRGEFGYIHIHDKSYRDILSVFIYPGKEQYPYNVFELHFDLSGAGKRLEGSARHTDYSYYLEKIVPVLERDGFHFSQIRCHDLG